MTDVKVRPASVTDAGEVAQIQTEVWRTAFVNFLPATVLEIPVSAIAQQWHHAIASPPSSSHRVLVAQEQQWVVGFATCSPADSDEPHAKELSTYVVGALLVSPRWGRRGHGSRLLAACADLAKEDGVARLVCWIPEADAVTRSFLTSAGWALDGYARLLDSGSGELREVRMHTELSPA